MSSVFARVVLGLGIAIMAFGIAVESANAVPRKVKRECRGDYKSLCPRYKAGTSRMRSCMRSKGRQLSWGCYQALKDYGYVKSRRSGSRRGSRSRRRRR
ncbi:MAG: hypothetical protein JXQ99_01230 [Hyphomicrobiaceae bacterium]